jgi:hypothetical protein
MNDFSELWRINDFARKSAFRPHYPQEPYVLFGCPFRASLTCPFSRQCRQSGDGAIAVVYDYPLIEGRSEFYDGDRLCGIRR